MCAEEKMEHMLLLPQTDLGKTKYTMDITQSPYLTGLCNNSAPREYNVCV